jgi:hypothetical protein
MALQMIELGALLIITITHLSSVAKIKKAKPRFFNDY